METVVTFPLPQVQHDGSFAALSILCYENVVFKNEGYPEISQFWYSQGNLVVWKQHPSIAYVFPAKCMAFAFCLVDVVIENFNFQNERSLVIVNSSAHQASFTLVPVVSGRRGLISFLMPPIPIVFSKNGILPMVVTLSDSSQRQLPMSFVSSVPSPYILSAMPSQIPRRLDVLVRVVVVNLPENVENKQVFAFFAVAGSLIPISVINYSVAKIEFVSAYVWIRIPSNVTRSDSVTIAIQIQAPLITYTTDGMALNTYQVRPSCELQREVFFVEDSGRTFSLFLFVSWPGQMQQLIVT
jgi:hypothetical protein